MTDWMGGKGEWTEERVKQVLERAERNKDINARLDEEHNLFVESLKEGDVVAFSYYPRNRAGSASSRGRIISINRNLRTVLIGDEYNEVKCVPYGYISDEPGGWVTSDIE